VIAIGSVRRFAAVFALAGAVLVAPGVALAAEPFAKAERLCGSQGGYFNTPGIYHYTCSGVPNLTPKQLQATERLCEHTYGGTFSSGPTYTCSDIPS